jgi:predicted DNA binding protein
MSILVEFTISRDHLEFARHIEEIDSNSVRLDRLVPSDGRIISYVWVTAAEDAISDLTAIFKKSDTVAAVTLLDRLETDISSGVQQLYRLEWIVDDLGVIQAATMADGAVLEGYTTDGYWFLRLRFPNHDGVIQFYQYLSMNQISDFTIERVYELTDHPDRDETYGLTPDQRETLTIAAQRGYFSIPRETTLGELADELDISQQAVSQRLRRATRSIVFAVLNLPD